MRGKAADSVSAHLQLFIIQMDTAQMIQFADIV